MAERTYRRMPRMTKKEMAVGAVSEFIADFMKGATLTLGAVFILKRTGVLPFNK